MQYDNFGKFVRQKREALKPKVSLNAFAFEIDLEPATLSRIERDLQSITLTEVGKIASRFNQTASELIKEYETIT